MKDKEGIIKELIELGAEVDSKIIENQLKDIYMHEIFALNHEINCIQKCSLRFLLLPLLFDLSLLLRLVITGKSFLNTIIIAIILGTIIIIDELINKFEINSLENKIEKINIQMNK
ncbi:hypothetical protein EJM73_06440 [Clostridium botulinum]|uniref:hypothetical protein n=1 Tax=Clostridium botulinum TaxID=1491 RepID=UPI00099BB0E7|nr:hypothetical protein [Clostridium botulinum]MCC5439783.1 hypothetical protein [Clostridium botulinum]NCI20595.1 hypothetical protein [Clostridium botulinum]NCI35304.1 hypothetical protein [Clostridium botulinum]NCI72104.1 hypothetical protein [Clostridium botulinum]NDI38217.1 hypothetical protein [Clostridium botulinum]